MTDAVAVARNHNALVPLHRKLSPEIMFGIFLALSLIHTPCREYPRGWFVINEVCSYWRNIAVNYPELWARSAGSFASREMTELAIRRAKNVNLSLDGHHENYESSGYVLTPDQLRLIAPLVGRLRSLSHDDYVPWADLFNHLRVFPVLEMARIWDESGLDMWSVCIEAPRLRSLYLNNTLIPFNAPALRYLRIDMDNDNWRMTADISDDDISMSQGCQSLPRVFPTQEFIAFLQRTPHLEHLVVTDMPQLLASGLPSPWDSELSVELPELRMLHLGGKSMAMNDLWQRLHVDLNTQIFIDTAFFDESEDLDPALRANINTCIRSGVYDSLKMGMSPTYDALLQLWSSDTSHNKGGLELITSLGTAESVRGPAFTLRFHVGEGDTIGSGDFLDPQLPPDEHRGSEFMNTSNDPYLAFEIYMSHYCHKRVGRILGTPQIDSPFSLNPTPLPDKYNSIRYLDFSDMPFPAGGIKDLYTLRFMPGTSAATHVTVDWSLFDNMKWHIVDHWYISPRVEDLTVVNFPCASYPNRKRYDEHLNDYAWSKLVQYLHSRARANNARRLTLKFAESTSDRSNLLRANEPKYEHTIAVPYEQAVRAITEKYCKRFKYLVHSFEDLRIHDCTY